MTANGEFIGLNEADQRLKAVRFGEKSLDKLYLPQVNTVELADRTIGHTVAFGNPQEAEHIVYTSPPYSTWLSDDWLYVRLRAYQTVLGPDYCVVADQPYDPKQSKLNWSQRKEIKNGSLRSIASRHAEILEKVVSPQDDQKITLFGFSFAGDVAIETVWQGLYDEDFALPEIDRIGVVDFARAKDRFSGFAGLAFAKSGDEIAMNIEDSRSVALSEAWGITGLPTDKAKKEIDKKVKTNVTSWVGADIMGNIALLKAFGTDVSVAQLSQIIYDGAGPTLFVGRNRDQDIFGSEALDGLWFSAKGARGVDFVEYPGDHSNGDNLQKSSAYVLRTVGIV